MTTFLTSAVYDVWRLLTRLMNETDWPAIVENQDGVAVWFGDPTVDLDADADIPASVEKVVVVPAIDVAEQQYGPIGKLARNETFNCLIVAMSAVPGFTAVQAADRLEQITATIENRIRSVLADGRNNRALQPEIAKYQVALIETVRVAPIVIPADQGWIARAEVHIGCQFRVGTDPVTP